MKSPGRLWTETVVEAMGADSERMRLSGFVWFFNICFLVLFADILWFIAIALGVS